jgi:hypothetical protein
MSSQDAKKALPGITEADLDLLEDALLQGVREPGARRVVRTRDRSVRPRPSERKRVRRRRDGSSGAQS